MDASGGFDPGAPQPGGLHCHGATLRAFLLQHVELIARRQTGIDVLVMTGGEVSQQILTLAEPVRQEHLSLAADRLNQVCLGKTTRKLPPCHSNRKLEKDILTLVLQDMNHSEQRVSGEIYLDGLTNFCPNRSSSNRLTPAGSAPVRGALAAAGPAGPHHKQRDRGRRASVDRGEGNGKTLKNVRWCWRAMASRLVTARWASLVHAHAVRPHHPDCPIYGRSVERPGI